MKTLTYFAIAEKNANGELWVRFPDFDGCISCGNDLREAINNAQEALALHLWGMQKDGVPIPEPCKNVQAAQNEVIVAVSVCPDMIAERMSKKRVKVNCTIPQWVKTQAENRKINFSKVLESALKEAML